MLAAPVSAVRSSILSSFRSAYAYVRPWRLFFDLSAFSLPRNYTEASNRFRRNDTYFSGNNTIVTLTIVFFSLIYHPISMIIFLISFFAWITLYFGREEPFVVIGRIVDDLAVLIVLCALIELSIVWTHVELNVFVGLISSCAVIGVHGVFRDTADLPLDESEKKMAGLICGLV